MDDNAAGALALSLLLGIAGTVVGGWHCMKGHNYAVAAENEATIRGRVIGMLSGRGSSAYHYVFSINGVGLDDYSDVCATPIVPGACDNKGPVLVYYSYKPFTNSRLEDFAVASARAYRIGKPVSAIGFPLLLLSSIAIAIAVRKSEPHDDQEPEDRRWSKNTDDVPDSFHIAPRE